MDTNKFKAITDQLMEPSLRASVKKFASNAHAKHDDDSYMMLCRDRHAACPDCAQVVVNRLVVFEALLPRNGKGNSPRVWRKRCVNCKECWEDTSPNKSE